MQYWRTEAACAALTVGEQDMFFGDSDTDMSVHKQHELARTVCYGCDPQVECLAYSISIEAGFGIWGGLTESQRKRYLSPLVRRAVGQGRKMTPDELSEVIFLCGSSVRRRQRAFA